MRLFLALRIEGPMKKALMNTMHNLKSAGVKGNYTPADNLHITLAFIGETDRAADIKAVIGALPVPPMRIRLNKFAMYGNILVAEAGGNQKLKEYASNVRTALEEARIDFDHKRFSPHITLVRRAGGNFKNVPLPKESVMIRHVSLMKSVRKDGKMVYTEIAGWG